MSPQRINVLLKTLLLLGSLSALPVTGWASPLTCADPEGGGIGGTGMGGTGIVAEGTGMGGTGITGIAGKVMFSHGHVEAMNNGKSRLLAKGDPVCVGDTIHAAAAASAQLMMVDKEMIALRPQTKLRIDNYAYRRKHDDTIALALLQGACRIVSGEIGKHSPQNDLIKTPSATIGVRGTDHEAVVILPGQNAAYPAGTYDKVNSGVTFIKTEQGSIDIHPNQVGFTASPAEMPQLLRNMPVFYNEAATPQPSREADMESASGRHEGMDGAEQASEVPEWTNVGETEMHSLPEPQSLPEIPQQPEPPSVNDMMPSISPQDQ